MDTTTLVDGIAQKQSRIDKSYFKTFSGILKVTEIVLTIICLILVSTWFRFILYLTLILTLVCSSVYFFRLRNKIKRWTFIELYVTGTVAGLFVIGMAIQFLLLHFVDGILSCVAGLVYSVGTYMLYRDFRSQILEKNGVAEVVESNFNRTVQKITVFQ